MAHTIREKTKLLNRVRRIRGQMDAIERGLENEQECFETLRQIAACRGAINSLMVEVLEGHIRFHVMQPGGNSKVEADAGEQLIEIVRAYLK